MLRRALGPLLRGRASRIALAFAAAASLRCSSEGTTDDPLVKGAPPDPPGTFVDGGTADPTWLRDRRLDYLRFETRELRSGSPVNILAHLARARLEPGYSPGGGPLPGDAWDLQYRGMDALEDGRDFQGLYLLFVLLSYGDEPTISPALKKNVEEALTRFKFWYSDPTPPGKRDDSYYWTENHQALYHTIEYLVGGRFPDRPVGTDGKPGREHAAIAKARLLRWLEHRLRFGFAEWHSNVYYQKTMTPLLTLVEHAPDEDVRVRASAVLDTLFLDLALHTQKDAFGVTHGRSYKKDKMTSTDEDTWTTTKLLFGTSAPQYEYGTNDEGAAIFAATTKYVYPEIIRRAGVDRSRLVDRERMGLPIKETPPVDEAVVAPHGYSYTKLDDLMIWWGMGALTTWPVVPTTIEEFEKYDLWSNASLKDAAPFKTVAGSPQFAQNLSANSHAIINFGLLSEVDTYTYRDGEVMLSSAIDYRKGTFNQQMHSWQATLDARAIVFTNHPFRPLATSGDWKDDPENGGYWNGEATAPRSAQFETVGIHIYAPQYPKTNGTPFEYFHWEPYTHAYFPQEYFDEFEQRGAWTFGRLGKGYVALFSHRPAKYVVYDGVTQATGGRKLPFDLRADGGGDNVWIVEVGTEAASGSFASWKDAITAARLEVKSLGAGKASGESDGFDVVFDSPSKGTITFGWAAPLVVKGTEIPLRGPGRFDNPYAHVPSNPSEIVIEKDGYGVKTDIMKSRRFVYGPK